MKIRSTTRGDRGWRVRLEGETGKLSTLFGRRRYPRANISLIRHDRSVVGTTGVSRRELRKLHAAITRVLGEETVPKSIADRHTHAER